MDDITELDKDISNVSHQCSWYGVLDETIDQTLDRVIEHWYFDLFENYPDVKKFLETPEWKALLDKHGMNKQHITSLQKVEVKNPHTLSPKVMAFMQKAAILLVSALSTTSCSDRLDQNNETEKRLISKNHVGTYSGALEKIKITDDNDMEKEAILYKKAFFNFEKAQSLIKHLKLFPNEDISFDRFLPLIIKESRLLENAKSKNGAVGYFQLKDIAIDEVNTFLEKHAIDTKWFMPKTNPSHNMMYGVLYFLHTAELLTAQYPNIQNLDDFVYASYNAGITKTLTLLAASNATSWDKFVDYVVDDKMWLSGKYKEVDSPYGPKVRDFFNGKDYSKDEKVIFKKDKIVLTRSKAQEFIRYVETINAINKSIDKERNWLQAQTLVPIGAGSTLFATIKDMKKNGTLKLKDGTNLIEFCNDIALDNNMNPDHIMPKDTLVLTKDMMEQFDYIDTNTYKYDVVEYNTASKYFLEKIVKEKVRDKTFQDDVIHQVPQLDSLEDIADREFYLMNSLIAFNTQNRKGWSTITSKNAWVPSEARYYTNFFNQSEKEVEKTEENINIDIKGTYISPSFEAIGKQFVYEGNATTKELLDIGKSIIHMKGKKQSILKPKLIHPTYIILHSTAANISDISSVKAHFFVSKEWKIYELTDKDGNFRELNHAGFWTKWCGAIRWGDKNITYKSLWIEVEALGGEEWNAKEYAAVKNLISYLWFKYKIQKKNVLTHSQIAFSSVGRWRKQDPYFVNWKKLWDMPNNYTEIDKDVAKGKSPNMAQFVKELKDMWMTNTEITYYLGWIDAGITIANNKKVKKMNAQDRKARSTSSTILKSY